MRYSVFLLLYLPLFAACGGSHQDAQRVQALAVDLDYSDTVAIAPEAVRYTDLAVPPALDEVVPPLDASANSTAQIIKNASIRFQVEDLAKSTGAIQQAVKSKNGYINRSNETRNNSEMSSSITIRVPFSQFDSLLEELLKQSVFLNTKKVTSKDVTEEFVDIQARVKAKKAAEQRYLDILRQAKTVKDVLEVENQLRQIREETEAQEGRLQYLKDQVQYSTINLEIYQQTTYQPEPEPGFFLQLLRSLHEGGALSLAFLVSLVRAWPLLLLAFFAVSFLLRWRKRRNAKKDPVNH